MDNERQSRYPDGKDDRNFTYDAFISYRHVDRDRKWALWLMASLKACRILSEYAAGQRISGPASQSLPGRR